MNGDSVSSSAASAISCLQEGPGATLRNLDKVGVHDALRVGVGERKVDKRNLGQSLESLRCGRRGQKIHRSPERRTLTAVVVAHSCAARP